MTRPFQRIRDPFAEDGGKQSYYVVYTILFCIFAFFVFSWCIFSGKSLINDGDGWVQYFRALIYYGQYLRQIVRNLWAEHRIVIPDWDFYISEGSDILNALHYYVVGDPIALLSVFVPTRFMHYFYSFSCVLLLYLAGIAFSALAFGTGCKNRCGIMAGALSYCFCSWEIIQAGRLPFFLNPCVYFPLVILGVEKIIRREAPYLFILSVAVSAASNFYFFYMIVLLTVGYTLIRIGTRYGKDLKRGVPILLRIAGMSVVGACLAGIILLPVLAIFLHDSRLSSSAQPLPLFYPLAYYGNLPAIAISGRALQTLFMGFSAPVILALLLLLFQKGKDRLLKILFGVCLLIILFPVFGWILNGMSYAANRWSWAFALLCSYILTKKWDTLLRPSRSIWKKMLGCCFLFVLYSPCLLFASPQSATSFFPALLLLFLSLILVRNAGLNEKSIRKRQSLLLLIICICATNLGYGYFSPLGLNRASELISNNAVLKRLNNNETDIVKELSNASYPRYSGQFITGNVNITNRISNTQYYWSLSNPYTSRFRSDLEMSEPFNQAYLGYDDRTSLLSLSAVSYYVTKSEDAPGMPYGYTLAGSDAEQSYFVYENQYALPLGYCYDSYATRETWESLDAVQKQELQMESVFLEGDVGEITRYVGQISDYSIPYRLECSGNEITETESGFVTTATNTTAILSFEGRKNAETYLCLEGIRFAETPECDLYSDDQSVDPLDLYGKAEWELLSRGQRIKLKAAKLLKGPVNTDTILIATSSAKVRKGLISPDVGSSSGRRDYVINLGYTEDPAESITITFLKRGVYTIENLRVYSVPMDGYAEKIGALQRNTLQNIQLGTDEVRGDLTVDEPKLLCVAIPYSEGWEASVDGVETPVMVANGRYLGVPVPAGSHKIELHYRTPYKRAGFALSLAGMAALAAVTAVTEKRRRRNGKRS